MPDTLPTVADVLGELGDAVARHRVEPWDDTSCELVVQVPHAVAARLLKADGTPWYPKAERMRSPGEGVLVEPMHLARVARRVQQAT